PRKLADREAWGVLYPAIKEATMVIGQAMTDPMMLPVANALREQLRETMRLFDMEGDLDRFLPQMPQIPPMAPALPAPGAPPEVAGPPVTDEMAFGAPAPTETAFAPPV